MFVTGMNRNAESSATKKAMCKIAHIKDFFPLARTAYLKTKELRRTRTTTLFHVKNSIPGILFLAL